MTSQAQRRWRLALGKFAEPSLGDLAGQDIQIGATLDYLYDREYQARGLTPGRAPKGASLDPTVITAVEWLGKARKLFPVSVLETLQSHALERYELTGLLNDPQTLRDLEPSPGLLKTLLAFSGRAKPAMKDKLRAVTRRIIDDIMKKLATKVTAAFSGRRNRFARSKLASAANFDWRATLRANLSRFDQERGRVIAEHLIFNARQRRSMPWTIVLCVDQSGSMTDSLIHAAVMGAILSGLPGVKTKMVLFDTSIVDVTDTLADPLETLLSVQLGGGTDIGKAVSYCEKLISDPQRTIFALVTDFYEGGAPRTLYSALARLGEARVKMIGLTALDEQCLADFDHQTAAKCASLGMKVGAMTPDRFADWLAEQIR